MICKYDYINSTSRSHVMLECEANVFDVLSTKEAQRKLILSFEFPWTPKLETEVFKVLAN